MTMMFVSMLAALAAVYLLVAAALIAAGRALRDDMLDVVRVALAWPVLAASDIVRGMRDVFRRG